MEQGKNKRDTGAIVIRNKIYENFRRKPHFGLLIFAFDEPEEYVLPLSDSQNWIIVYVQPRYGGRKCIRWVYMWTAKAIELKNNEEECIKIIPQQNPKFRSSWIPERAGIFHLKQPCNWDDTYKNFLIV